MPIRKRFETKAKKSFKKLRKLKFAFTKNKLLDDLRTLPDYGTKVSDSALVKLLGKFQNKEYKHGGITVNVLIRMHESTFMGVGIFARKSKYVLRTEISDPNKFDFGNYLSYEEEAIYQNDK